MGTDSGIFNDNFNKISKIKEEQRVIKELWNFIYDKIKKRIWIPRCKEVRRLEEKEDIRKSDLRLKKQVLAINVNENLDIIKLIKTKKQKKIQEKIRKIIQIIRLK
jgi:hypothetical protein